MSSLTGECGYVQDAWLQSALSADSVSDIAIRQGAMPILDSDIGGAFVKHMRDFKIVYTSCRIRSA